MPTQVINELYRRPKRDKGVNAPTFQNIAAGIVHQADTLYLPEDDGFKYLLVVIDNGSRKVDAEPLKTHNATDVAAAFKRLYGRSTLKKPKYIEVDAGTEFKGACLKYFKDEGIKVRVAKTGRHRMQALVERANQTIGTALHKRMTEQELLTGEPSREWLEDLPKVLEEMNKKAAKRKPPAPKKQPLCEGDACKVYEEGTKVRVMLEAPRSVQGDRLHGRFRASDIRWDPKIRTIKTVTIQRNMPPLYILDGNVGNQKIEPVGYTKNQIQKVKADEEYPDGKKVIRGNPQTWIVEKILGKVKEKNRWYYTIKWRGFKDTTLEPATTIKADIPEMTAEFEASQKAKQDEANEKKEKKQKGKGIEYPCLMYF